MNRVGELTRARAFHGLSDDDCLVWFGVGISTLERIEAGEVEPSDELDERINRFLNVVGAGLSLPVSAPLHGAPSPHGGVPLGGGGMRVAPAAPLGFQQ